MGDPAPQSIRSGFVWSFVGNSLYSLAQWLLLVVLARLASPHAVGEFALLLAISAPAFLLLGLNLRLVQATDAESRWSLAEYLLLRHVVNVGAAAVTVLAAHFLGDLELLSAAAALAGAKAVESVSQTYYGYFQQRERHDFVAQSMVARSVAGPVGFTVGYLLTGQLVGACLGLLAGWLIIQKVLDRPRAAHLATSLGDPVRRLWPTDWQKIGKLGRHAAPLGLDQGVTSLAVNVPRYAVQAHAGTVALGVYSALSYLAQIISMVASSLGMVVVPRLAQYKHSGRRAEFVRLLAVSTIFSLAVSIVVLAGAAAFGEPVIRLLLGAEYVDQDLLLLLLVGAAAVTLQRSLGRGLTGAHRYATFLVIDLVTLIAVSIAAIVWVPDHGVLGAAAATVAGNVIGALACLVPLVRVIRSIDESAVSA